MSRVWKIEKYRNPLEPKEQWELKKKFLETYQDSFPEDRVVSMAQVLVNIEFLGCRYPVQTMKEVAELSRGIVEEFRERQKTRLQRTFVGAAEAAGARFKGKKAQVETSEPPAKKRPDEQKEEVEEDDVDDEEPKKKKRKKKKKMNDDNEEETKEEDDNNATKLKKKEKKQENPLSNLVIVLKEGLDETQKAIEILTRSASLSRVTLDFDFRKLSGNNMNCSVKLNGITIAEATDENKKVAKKSASAKALEILKKKHFIITEKAAETSVVSTDEISTKKPDTNSAVESGIGNRLMKLMGWAGGGLGAAEQGRVEPVLESTVIGKAGLGYTSTGTRDVKLLQKMVTKKLQEYISQDGSHSLVFPPEYNTEERKMIHSVARRFGLKSTSTGTDPNRKLIVSRKIPSRVSLLEFAQFLLQQQQLQGSQDSAYANFVVSKPE